MASFAGYFDSGPFSVHSRLGEQIPFTWFMGNNHGDTEDSEKGFFYNPSPCLRVNFPAGLPA